MVIELEKLDKVSSERVELVEECLANIGRLDLAKKVSAYKMTGEIQNRLPSERAVRMRCLKC